MLASGQCAAFGVGESRSVRHWGASPLTLVPSQCEKKAARRRRPGASGALSRRIAPSSAPEKTTRAKRQQTRHEPAKHDEGGKHELIPATLLRMRMAMGYLVGCGATMCASQRSVRQALQAPLRERWVQKGEQASPLTLHSTPWRWHCWMRSPTLRAIAWHCPWDGYEVGTLK